MSDTKNGKLSEHAQRYIRAVMSERLQQEGFHSKDGDDIHWYRVVNECVVHSVYFITRHTQLPMILVLGYGCHPLFISPIFPKGPYLYGLPGNEIVYPEFYLVKNCNKFCYAADAMVSCPDDEYMGSDFLEKVFSRLEQAQTPLACYEMHKKWREEAISNQNYYGFSPQFVDEVIYWNDRVMYPFCIEYIDSRIDVLERAQERTRLAKSYLKEMDYLRLLRHVILDDTREEHLVYLKQKEQETVRLLKKHANIELAP